MHATEDCIFITFGMPFIYKGELIIWNICFKKLKMFLYEITNSYVHSL